MKLIILTLLMSVNTPIRAEMLEGIVNADTLYCRKSPTVKSQVVTALHFGEIHKLIEKSSDKAIVNKTKDYWYKVEKENCWTFGSYLLVESQYDKALIPETISNIQTEWEEPFSPIFSQKYFIYFYKWSPWSTPLRIENKEYSEPMIVVVGEVKKQSNDSLLFTVKRAGVYSEDGNFLGIVNNRSVVLKEEILVNKYKDSNGEFYAYKFQDRSTLQKKADEDYSENNEIFYRWFFLKKIKLETSLYPGKELPLW